MDSALHLRVFVFYSMILAFGIAISTQATPILGSIAVSIILIDSDGNITNGSGNEGKFVVRLDSPNGFEADLEFQTPLLFNSSAFDDGVMNSQSIVISSLPVVNIYHYTMAIIEGNWVILGYNDQLITKVSSLDDFYPYDAKNLDSNGAINLALTSKPERELLILLGNSGENKTSSIPVNPEPSTIIMVSTGVGLIIARGMARWRKNKKSQKIS